MFFSLADSKDDVVHRQESVKRFALYPLSYGPADDGTGRTRTGDLDRWKV
jgi:hypothetical protein